MTPFNPKRGDRVLVRNLNAISNEWYDGIYLATIEGTFRPFVTVDVGCEEHFLAGVTVSTNQWAEMRPFTKKTLTKAQIADKFGVSVEELEITE